MILTASSIRLHVKWLDFESGSAASIQRGPHEVEARRRRANYGHASTSKAGTFGSESKIRTSLSHSFTTRGAGLSQQKAAASITCCAIFNSYCTVMSTLIGYGKMRTPDTSCCLAQRVTPIPNRKTSDSRSLSWSRVLEKSRFGSSGTIVTLGRASKEF